MQSRDAPAERTIKNKLSFAVLGKFIYTEIGECACNKRAIASNLAVIAKNPALKNIGQERVYRFLFGFAQIA